MQWNIRTGSTFIREVSFHETSGHYHQQLDLSRLPLTEATQCFPLHAVRGGDACCYLLTDLTVPAGTPCTWTADFPAGIQLSVQELRPVYVPMNSDPTLFSTPNYELCYAIIDSVCTSFQEYTMDPAALDQVKLALFNRLDTLDI